MARTTVGILRRMAGVVLPTLAVAGTLAACGSQVEQLGALSEREIAAQLREAPASDATTRELDRHAGALLPAQGKPDAQVSALIRDLGKPVVVNLWADYCAPCRDELPMFQRAALEFRGKSTVLGAATLSNRADSEKYLETIALPFPSLLDDDGVLASGTGLSVLPKTIFYSATGERLYVKQGPYRTLDDLRADIKRYMT